MLNMYTTRAEMLAQLDRISARCAGNNFKTFRDSLMAYPDSDPQMRTHAGFPFIAAAIGQLADRFEAGEVVPEHEMIQLFAALLRTMKLSNDLVQKLNRESREKHKAIVAEFAMEDHRLKLDIKDGKRLTLKEIVELNRKLERVIETGFARTPQPTPAPSDEEEGSFAKKFIAALSRLFKSLADPTQNKESAQQTFMGTILVLILAFIGKIFKGFSGPDSSKQIDELVSDAEKAFQAMSFTNPSPLLMSGGPQRTPAASVPAAGQSPAPAPRGAADDFDGPDSLDIVLASPDSSDRSQAGPRSITI